MMILNIDKLELACSTDEANREYISQQECLDFQFFYMVKNTNESNYKIKFDIFMEDGKLYGNLYFGSYNFNRQRIYLSINNEIFYNGNLGLIDYIIDSLNLEFHSISKLDLALDFDSNIINTFYKLLKMDELSPIILNRKYDMQCKEIKNLINVSTGSRKNVRKFKSFYITNKERGLCLNAYDKTKEIADNDYQKQYIIDKLDMKKIFRLEIRTNHTLLLDSIKKLGYTDDYLYDLIVTNQIHELFELYKHLLNRLIRFDFKGKVISFLDLLM